MVEGSSPFAIPNMSVSSRRTDVTAEAFGLLESDPVPVGGSFDRGLDNMRSYLLRLIGPNGEETSFTRLGTCGHFDSDSSPFGRGLLEKYSVTYEGLEEPIVVYIDWCERDELGSVPGLQLK